MFFLVIFQFRKMSAQQSCAPGLWLKNFLLVNLRIRSYLLVLIDAVCPGLVDVSWSILRRQFYCRRGQA